MKLVAVLKLKKNALKQEKQWNILINGENK
jgi:hypothetical protein